MFFDFQIQNFNDDCRAVKLSGLCLTKLGQCNRSLTAFTFVILFTNLGTGHTQGKGKGKGT